MWRHLRRSTAAHLVVGSALLLLLGCGGNPDAGPPCPAWPALFVEEAGPPSCMICHGKDATGNPELATPDIRGKTAADVRKAIQNGELMRLVYSSLSDQDIEALVAYLEFLVRQK